MEPNKEKAAIAVTGATANTPPQQDTVGNTGLPPASGSGASANVNANVNVVDMPKGNDDPAQRRKDLTPAPKDQRDMTDVLLGELVLIVMGAEKVHPAYHFIFLISRPILFLGSDPARCGEHNIILSQDHGIAPCHASIRWQEGRFVVQDEGAPDGTMVDGKRLVAYTATPLGLKGVIRLGNLHLRYALESPIMQALMAQAAHASQPVKQELAGKHELPDVRPEATARYESSPMKPETALQPSANDDSKSAATATVVIAEFLLLSLDVDNALPRYCEIKSDQPTFLLGRGAHCDYQVEFKEKYVADEQAIIQYSAEEQTFAIKGLVKENPILVNNQRVKEIQRLASGDVIRLGSAMNAPKIRFALEGQDQKAQTVALLSKLLPLLHRGKSYYVGGGPKCQIQLGDPTISGAVAQLFVPLQGDNLLVSKLEPKVKVTIDEGEVKDTETRSLSIQQTLHVGSFFALVHDHKNLTVPRTPVARVLSDFIPFPQRGAIYPVGSGDQCVIRLDAPELPELVAEIAVPMEGEAFLVKKYGGVEIEVVVDTEAVSDGPRAETHYNINQVLTIGDFFVIRNNHRSLPTPASPGVWKSLLKGLLWLLFLAFLFIAAGMAVQKYWPNLTKLISTQNLMKKYQANVFYIAVFDKTNQKNSSGTGFLVVQKDAEEQERYYLVTCKHVIQPWKFEEHKEKDGTIVTKDDQPIEPYFIAAWPCGVNAIDAENKEYLFAQSFTNYPVATKLGEVEIYRTAEDAYQMLPDSIRRHEVKSSQDLIILQLKPKLAQGKTKWGYAYENWTLSAKDKLDVGDALIVLGYPLGGGRLLTKNGMAVPASCEGKLTSDCQAPDFLEINVNQTQGASGGPIVNRNGEVVGMVSFADSDKKFVYGIHSAVLRKLFK